MIIIIVLAGLILGFTVPFIRNMKRKDGNNRFSYNTRGSLETLSAASYGAATLFGVVLVATIALQTSFIISNKANIPRRQAVIRHLDEQIKTGLVEKYYGKAKRLEEIGYLEKAKADIVSGKKTLFFLTLYRY